MIMSDRSYRSLLVQIPLLVSAIEKYFQGQTPAATTLIQDLGDYVRAMYGNSNVVLGEFGMAPRKRAKATVATKQEAIAKSAATRVARHTAGPKQKAKIHGEA